MITGFSFRLRGWYKMNHGNLEFAKTFYCRVEFCRAKPGKPCIRQSGEKAIESVHENRHRQALATLFTFTSRDEYRKRGHVLCPMRRCDEIRYSALAMAVHLLTGHDAKKTKKKKHKF